MKIATWNVNSVRARLERAEAWLGRHRPDVVCLQEIKCVTEVFPYDQVAAAGYHAAVWGQKAYNGVAILSLVEPADVCRGMADAADDDQARLISARIGDVRVFSAYVPNGREVGTEAYAYKLDWLARLREHLAAEFSPSQPLALCGDFNVVLDDLDARSPRQWDNTVLCHQDARDGLARIRQWGLSDVFRKHNLDGGVYSWWDYRGLSFPKNNGLRLDHVYATAPLAETSTSAVVHRDERKGTKPSDHAPVVVEFDH